RIAEAAKGSRRIGGTGIDRVTRAGRQPVPARLVGIEYENVGPARPCHELACHGVIVESRRIGGLDLLVARCARREVLSVAGPIEMPAQRLRSRLATTADQH